MVEEFESLDKALSQFEERTERQAVLGALRAGGRVVIRYAKENAPEGQSHTLEKSFMSKAGRFRPGLFARIDLGISQRDDVTMIPEDAILQRSDGSGLEANPSLRRRPASSSGIR